jgi:hypothetical protein
VSYGELELLFEGLFANYLAGANKGTKQVRALFDNMNAQKRAP